MVNVFLSWLSGPTSKEEVSYVSPENPRFQTLSPAENDERMAQLHDDLQKIGIPEDHIRMTQFFDTRTGYTEHSFYIEDIELEDALLLAERYGQAEILTDEGIVDVGSRELKTPTKSKITGPEALQQPAYSMIEGLGPVSYQFDTPEVRGEEPPIDPNPHQTDLKREFYELVDATADDIMKMPLNPIERDTLISLDTQAKEAVMADDLETAGNALRQISQYLEKRASQGSYTPEP